jgi:hypothetical protein
MLIHAVTDNLLAAMPRDQVSHLVPRENRANHNPYREDVQSPRKKRPYCGLRTVTRGTTVTPFLFQGLPIGAMEDDLAARHRAIAAARTTSKATYAMFQDPKTLPTVLAQLFNVCTQRNRVLPSGS